VTSGVAAGMSASASSATAYAPRSYALRHGSDLDAVGRSLVDVCGCQVENDVLHATALPEPACTVKRERVNVLVAHHHDRPGLPETAGVL
jgi:hypothetical protein